jgi:hypothetical protein
MVEIGEILHGKVVGMGWKMGDFGRKGAAQAKNAKSVTAWHRNGLSVPRALQLGIVTG